MVSVVAIMILLIVSVFRYLQAKFIEMKSRQAREKAEKDCENQLFHAFSATEKLRQEVGHYR